MGYRYILQQKAVFLCMKNSSWVRMETSETSLIPYRTYVAVLEFAENSTNKFFPRVVSIKKQTRIDSQPQKLSKN